MRNLSEGFYQDCPNQAMFRYEPSTQPAAEPEHAPAPGQSSLRRFSMTREAVLVIRTGPEEYTVFWGPEDDRLFETLSDILFDPVATLRHLLSPIDPIRNTRRTAKEFGTGGQELPAAASKLFEVLGPMTPLFRGVTLARIAEVIPYSAIDVLYLCRGRGVEVFVPVWEFPNVIRPWREHLDVRVYPADAMPPLAALPDDWTRLRQAFDSLEPVWVLDSEAIPQSSQLDPAIADILRTYSTDIWSAHWEFLQREDDAAWEPGQPFDIVPTQYYNFVSYGPDSPVVPASYGRGFLIQLDSMTEYSEVVEDVRRRRYAKAMELNAMSSVTHRDEAGVLRDFVLELLNRYQDRVFPFPYQPYDRLSE